MRSSFAPGSRVRRGEDGAALVFLDHELEEIVADAGADREILALVVDEMAADADVLAGDDGEAVAFGAQQGASLVRLVTPRTATAWRRSWSVSVLSL